MSKFDQAATLRDAAQELGATTSIQAKMAEALIHRAAESRPSREELMEAALETGRTPVAQACTKGQVLIDSATAMCALRPIDISVWERGRKMRIDLCRNSCGCRWRV
jgi:hypothetical protein